MIDAPYLLLGQYPALERARVLGSHVVMTGLTAARPPAGLAGRLYFATDTNGGQLARDDGASWVDVAAPINPLVSALRGGTWKVLYTDGSGVATELALGSTNTALVSGGPSAAPSFAAVVLQSLADAKGDLIVGTDDNAFARLAAGSNNQVLTADSAQTTGLKWASASSMLKTQNAGYFSIPTEPSAGTSVTSGSANSFGSFSQLTASTCAAIYIVGVMIFAAATSTYVVMKIGTGGAGSESTVGIWPLPARTATTTNPGFMVFPFPIPVAASTRIAVALGDNIGSQAWNVKLICINQADLVGI
jgi:hypothetical protein